MRQTLQFVLALTFFCIGCKAKSDSYYITTEHHILSQNDKVSIDTNQFDKKLLSTILRLLKSKADQSFLLITSSETSQVMLEFGVYNFQNSKFYYSLSRNNQHFFTDAATPEREALLLLVRPMAADSVVTDEEAKQFVKGNKSFIINVFKLGKTKKQIFIKSYQW